jgi:hypothetical protein
VGLEVAAMSAGVDGGGAETDDAVAADGTEEVVEAESADVAAVERASESAAWGEEGPPAGASLEELAPALTPELVVAQEAVAVTHARLQAWESSPPRPWSGQNEVAGPERVFAQGLVTGLFTRAVARGTEIVRAGETLDEQITSAVELACESLAAHVVQARESFTSQMTALRAQAIDEAVMSSALVALEHAATLDSIERCAAAALNTIDTLHDKAVRESEQAEQGQLKLVGRLYTDADTAYRAAGERAAGAASAGAAERAQSYRSHKIFAEDNELDGYLTDNRCEAEAEAAEKVGQAYAKQLADAAAEQADIAGKRRATDETAVHSVASGGRASLERIRAQSSSAVQDSRKQSIKDTNKLRTSLLSLIQGTLSSTLTNLSNHEVRSLAAFESAGTRLEAALRSQGAALRLQVAEAITTATSGVDAALGEVEVMLAGTPLPDPATATSALGSTSDLLEARIEGFLSTIAERGAQALASVEQAQASAFEQFDETAGMATDAATQTGEGVSRNFDSLSNDVARGFRDQRENAQKATGNLVQGAREATGQTLGGVKRAFAQVEESLKKGAERNAGLLEEGLMEPVKKDMPDVITTEARKARDEVQPRWKSVLKWVIIIAIVLVVAIFLGPMVVGFVAGIATAMGASAATAALVGTIVGGAIVGGLTSAATTLVDNAFAGRELTEGLLTAVVIGMVGGAIGGTVGAFVPVQNIASPLLRVAAHVGLDMVVDTSISIVTGNFSWENLGASLALSLLTNGVGSSARVKSMQHRMTGIGHGAGFKLGDVADMRSTSRPPLATPTVASAHINTGDVAGGGPYAGKWNMSGGGHNARAMDTSPTTAGYGSRTVAVEPISGARIQEYSRPVLDNAGNPAPSGAIKTTAKSQFPLSMGQPEIDAAAALVLGRALAGTPATSQTPPVMGRFVAIVNTPGGPVPIAGSYHNTPGHNLNIILDNPGTLPPGMTSAQLLTQAKNQVKTGVAGALHQPTRNGSFSGLVLTPEGHPLAVEGHYTQDTNGVPHVETVYPQSQLELGVFNPPTRFQFYGAPQYPATPPVPSPRREERDRALQEE